MSTNLPLLQLASTAASIIIQITSTITNNCIKTLHSMQLYPVLNNLKINTQTNVRERSSYN